MNEYCAVVFTHTCYYFHSSCLATNDLVGLLGMLTAALLKYNFFEEEEVPFFVRLDCVGHVVWRFFGVSSGCIAAVMAAERCMALARPFIYHKVSGNGDSLVMCWHHN